MENPIKKIATDVKGNPIGAITGVVAAVVLAKKFGHIENKWVLAAAGFGGLLAGIMVTKFAKAKMSTPTAAVVKK